MWCDSVGRRIGEHPANLDEGLLQLDDAPDMNVADLRLLHMPDLSLVHVVEFDHEYAIAASVLGHR